MGVTKSVLIKRILLGLVGFVGVTFLLTVVGLIKVGVFTGPMSWHDGAYHRQIEITVANSFGYTFGRNGPDDIRSGWFIPMKGN